MATEIHSWAALPEGHGCPDAFQLCSGVCSNVSSSLLVLVFISFYFRLIGRHYVVIFIMIS